MIAYRWVMGQAWAMLPEMVETLVSIAERTNPDPEAVAAKLGRPLENAHNVEVHDNGVAVIPVRGPISRYADMFSQVSGATSLSTLATDYRAALDNPDVRAIVLEIDSPGGQVSGIGEFAAQVHAGSKLKPTTAYVSSVGASAALWIASAAGRVVCAPQALMGSMGVVWPVARTTEKDKARSIEFVSSQSPNKRPDVETDAGKAEMQAIVDAMAECFVEDVARYRGLKPAEAIERFGRGGLRVGKAAVACGMADNIGSLEKVIIEIGRQASGGRAGISPSHPFAAGAPAVPPHEERSMKLNMPKLFTGWMSKGRPEVMESMEFIDCTADAEDKPAQSKETPLEANDSSKIDAKIEAAKAQWLAEMAAERRANRVELFGHQAEAYLSLLGGKILPAERANLKAAFVAASLIDAEQPVANFSALGGFKASLDARKPHGLTVDHLSGDASQVAAELASRGLKAMNGNAPTPDEESEAASEARIKRMLESTDEGRKALDKAK